MIKKLFFRYWYWLLVIIPWLIFVFSIWDHNFYIGGDVMVPLSPANNIQKVFLWDNGLESFQYVGFFWLAFYYLFSLIGFSAFVIQKILLVLLLIIGFVFTSLSYRELFKGTRYDSSRLSFLAAVIFTFNPIYFLLVNAYLPLCGFPVCFFFLIKFLQKNKILYAVLFSLLLNFFFFTDLPQPKLLIVFFIACFFLILVYRQTRKFNFKDILRRIVIISLLSFLLNAWVFVPLLHSIFFGAGASFVKEVGVFSGLADFKIAALPYIARFFNYNIVKFYPHLESFLLSPAFVILTLFQWIILVLGIFMAVKNKKDAKIICLLILPVIFFIFIAKGANPPFGQLFQFLVVHFPLAKIFRTSSSVITGAVIFYAFSLTVSTSYLLRRKKSIIYFIIVLNITIFYPLYFGYKFYNQINQASSQKGYPIPDQYYEMGKWLDNIEEDSKVLSIPLVRGYVEKNWLYSGPDILSWITIKPLIYREGGYGLGEVGNKNFQIVPESCGVYSLNNIQYVLFQKDTVGAENLYEYLEFGDLVTSNNYFDLYKIKDECFLPHFYVPQNIIYSNEEIGDLSNIVDFTNYNSRPGIYLENIGPKNLKNYLEFFKRADQVFIKTELENKVSQQELIMNRTPIDVENVFFPYVRWKPESWIYPLVLKKEQVGEWRRRNDSEQLLERKLFYAAKRISELKKWGLILNDNNWKETINQYEQKMEEVFVILEKMKQEQEEKSFFTFFDKVQISLKTHQEKLEDAGLNEEKNVQLKGVFEDLQNHLGQIQIKHDFSRLVYKLNLPEEKEYEMFMKMDNFKINKFIPSMTAIVDGEKIETGDLKIENNDWINLGKGDFTQGEHSLVLNFPKVENFITDAWRQFSQSEKENDTFLFSPQSIFTVSDLVLFQEIKNYAPNTIFRLAFDYKAEDGKVGFSIVQNSDKNIKTGETDPLVVRILDKTTDGKFSHAEIFIKSGPQALSAKIIFFVQSEENEVTDPALKNARVEKAWEPTIVFRAVVGGNKAKRATPKITFAKVNSTKYKVRIEEAKEPYFLVFSENFNQNWKAFIQPTDGNPQTYGETATYFNGEIKEGIHRNIFLNRSTFETWGKKPIVENKHYLVNGYANSWFIDPKDVGGNQDYEIIIEFLPQRFFYIGLGVALMTLLGCFGVLAYNFAKKETRGKKNEKS